MGRTGDSLEDEFPPRSGGRTPRREEPVVGRIAPRTWFMMVVVVVAAYYYFFVSNYC